MYTVEWGRYAHTPLGLMPTPLHELARAGAALGGGKRLFIKRDDLTGLALGGNKARKLEFVLGDVLAKGCDTVLTTGGAQSNHAAITAACCNKLGLTPRLVLLGRGVTARKGNLLLNHLMGVDVRFVDSDDLQDVYPVMEQLARELEAQGRRPYIIPLGASMPLGVLGYVRGMQELAAQLREQGVQPDHIVCCTGSGGTHAGVALGAQLFLPGTKVTGIAVGQGLSTLAFVQGLVRDTAALLGLPAGAVDADVCIHDYYGEGYAIPSPEGNAAIRALAGWEGIFLDPVYTGKTFAGLLDLNEQGYFGNGETILFLHTGGAATLFAVPME